MSKLLDTVKVEGRLIQIEELKINGKSLFTKWLDRLDKPERAEIRARLERVKHGNLGLHRNLRYGILELKFDSGLRVYGGWEGQTLLLLILGGNKRRQDEDIEVVQRIWLAYTKGITL